MENTLSLDQEWVELILEAKNQGYTKEEIKDFLRGLTPNNYK
ncbi:anti-repressor SinI family protein [Fictibacillus sp. b24]|nr:anti-repressor SinI family protein [Fictibacillus sp. b24]MDM5314847.1 anti-repressor SinI family protein [Fictibacillus sp. b24]